MYTYAYVICTYFGLRDLAISAIVVAMTSRRQPSANEPLGWRRRLALGHQVAIDHYVALGVAAENLFVSVHETPPVFSVLLWKVIEA